MAQRVCVRAQKGQMQSLVLSFESCKCKNPQEKADCGQSPSQHSVFELNEPEFTTTAVETQVLGLNLEFLRVQFACSP